MTTSAGPSDPATIRVLIASPGDVGPERLIVRDVIAELAREYRVPIDIFAWEDREAHLFDSATDAQEQIPNPETFDLVICLFGCRIGTRLRNTDANTRDYWVDGQPPTGTQYEYLRASRLHRPREEHPDVFRPFVRVYALAAAQAIARKPLNLRTRRSDPEDERQYEDLARFLTSLEGTGPNRVYEEFTGDDLPANVRADLVLFLQRIERIPAAWTRGNPYAGLAPMDEGHSAVFVGRENQIDHGIAAILRALDAAAEVPAFLLLTGPSGVGKSSLARAGIAARFRDRRRAGRLWRRLVVRPSELGPEPAIVLLRRLAAPAGANLAALTGRDLDLGAAAGTAPAGEAAEALRQALDAAEPGAALLLVVDQLEEALVPHQAPRYAPLFRALDLLARCGRAVVLATLAGNHVDALAGKPVLAALHRPDLHPAWTIPLREPDEYGLRRLIIEPMQRAGGTIEPALVERLLTERRALGEAQNGLLPLLQLALNRAYAAAARRAGVEETVPALGLVLLDDHFKGFDATLEEQGCEAMERFEATDDDKRQKLWRLFRRLVQTDSRLQEVVRKVPVAEMPADLKPLADHLANHRLLLGDQDGYALAHIELIRRWSLGQDWLSEERRLVTLRDRLLPDALQWHAAPDAAKRAKLDILPTLIEDAERLRTLWPDEDLGEPLRPFLDEAIPYVRAALSREKELQLQNYRLSARYLAGRAEALLETDPELSVLTVLEVLPQEAVPSDERPIVAEAGSALTKALACDRNRGVLRGHAGPVRPASFSPDGRRLITVSSDKTARLWDAHSGAEIAVLRGHEGPVNSAAFSPDGLLVATASDDKSARLWDAHSGAEIAILRGHEGPVNSAAFSPDGLLMATASSDTTARLWDALTGAEIAVTRGHESPVWSASFSPDGRRLITSSADNTARLWDAHSGAEIVVLRHKYTVAPASFSPDGRRLVTSDGTVRFWDAQSGAEIGVLGGHGHYVVSASFSPDGLLLATASSDTTARLWDVLTGAEIAVLSGHQQGVNTASFSPDGRRLVTASWDRTARLWDVQSGAEIAVLRGHDNIVWCASFSPDGRRLATSDGRVRFWDAQTGTESVALRGHEDWVHSASFSPDGQRLITVSAVDDNTARLWNAQSGAEIAVLQHSGASASFSPDGRLLVTASLYNSDTTARLWDAQSGAEIAVFRGHEDGVRSASFSPDGRRVVTASWDTTARLWDAQSGAEIAVFRGHGDGVRSASFSPDGGRSILTASKDATARLWDVRTALEISVLRGHQEAVSSASFSPDGARAVTVSDDGTARLWDAYFCAEIAVLRGHEDNVNSASFSSDGRHLATASSDRTARLWDAMTGAGIAVLRGHEGPVLSASFSPDGRHLATASSDTTMRLWDVMTGAEISVLRGHERPVRSASFSADGRRLVTASDDRTARLWDARASTLVEMIAFARLTRFRDLSDIERKFFYLPPRTTDKIANALEHAFAKVRQASGRDVPHERALLCLTLATDYFLYAGELHQARAARERRATLAWNMPVEVVAKVYQEAIRQFPHL